METKTGAGMKALQYVDGTYTDERRAQRDLDGLARQDGYLGGHVLTHEDGKILLQAFFEDDAPGSGWLPDGMIRVTLLHGMMVQCGVQE